MTDSEQVQMVIQGNMVWNRYREKTKITYPDLEKANLSGIDLSGSNFEGAILRHANISNSCLRGANLRDSDLSLSDLSNSDLFMANLFGTNLTEVKLDNTNFKEAATFHTTFGMNNLSTAIALDKIRHFGPSIVGIDTIFLSNDKIPEIFLRGAGVPDTFIEYMSSLTGKAFDYYSCFISYSNKDQEFAERLYADLQNKGVRCWFAQEDMKIGDKIRQRIDQSIKNHDKLLLILSEGSIDSEWCEDEVEAAYEQERIKDQTALFPVRIDNTIMDTDKAWASKLRRSRHIGDFTKWKDHNAYTKAFERLLRDLKA